MNAIGFVIAGGGYGVRAGLPAHPSEWADAPRSHRRRSRRPAGNRVRRWRRRGLRPDRAAAVGIARADRLHLAPRAAPRCERDAGVTARHLPRHSAGQGGGPGDDHARMGARSGMVTGWHAHRVRARRHPDHARGKLPGARPVVALGREPRRHRRGPADVAGGGRADFDTDPTWSPDGESIAFLRTNGSSPGDVYVVPADGGDAAVGARLSGPLGWSPDSETVAFDTLGGISLVPADGGDAEVLAPRVHAPGDWSPDGTTIAGTGGGHLRFVDVATGEVTDGGAAPAGVHAMEYSADGRHLAVAADGGLLIVEFDDAGSRPAASPSRPSTSSR